MTESVRVAREGSTLVITIDRPEVRNAVDMATALSIVAALESLDADGSVRVGVLTGAGGTFSAGMDLRAFLSGEPAEVPGRGFAGLTRTPPAKPLVAAVEGYALAGGFEMVLACDLVVSADNAWFGLPEVKRGLIAGSGGLLRFPQRVPRSVAMEHALTGEPLPAADAYRWGLVNRLTPPGEALPAALALAAQIACNGPLAVRVTKQIVDAAAAWSPDDAWARQDRLLAAILASQDAQEGAAAFVAKRPPVWRDS